MKEKRRQRCLCCKQLFVPDPRSRHHQEFCSDAVCQNASKVLSQQRWKGKPDNRNYWRGSEAVERVRAWRKANPNYWKRRTGNSNGTLQDDFIPSDPLLLGLISTIADSTLQDDIAATCRHLIRKGRDVLQAIRSNGGAPGAKKS
jgi:hypothetical protein